MSHLTIPQARRSTQTAYLVLACLLTACAVSQTPRAASPTATLTVTLAPDAWTPLRQRPLHLPTLASGAVCPADHGHTVAAQYGLALGDGPAYPVGLGTHGVLTYGPPANFLSQRWGGQKVLWAIAPSYTGPVLIRGHQLDGPHELRFDLGESGDPPPTELVFMATNRDPNGWTGQPSHTRVRAPGCYAYQVDGTSFTSVIVFLAAPQR